jgi:hypothetical protein
MFVEFLKKVLSFHKLYVRYLDRTSRKIETLSLRIFWVTVHDRPYGVITEDC